MITAKVWGLFSQSALAPPLPPHPYRRWGWGEMVGVFSRWGEGGGKWGEVGIASSRSLGRFNGQIIGTKDDDRHILPLLVPNLPDS